MTNKPQIEIMAPVGCWESLAAAIQAGATSVYFGIEHLNMRARSSVNFTTDDMATIVATCREAGVKTYLTVNTVMYPEDLPLMREIVDKAHQVGVDAIIASDIAVMQYANAIGQEVHLSTQLNIANTEALKFYAQFADVVVLARELNMSQVASIYRDIEEQHICGKNGEPIPGANEDDYSEYDELRGTFQMILTLDGDEEVCSNILEINTAVQEEQPVHVFIYDSRGVPVRESQVTHGIYLYRYEQGGQVWTEKKLIP